ncbi:cutinase family protein [Mycobacterium aquaticum]|uniref:Cutinase family protein n=1 Tax=Mycobacterium aquaticum TaxID=1927124 RepID=A0A1X0A3M2_9MYCO|nr:cutinase family protein [Mycobacterium aquaticum]ORA24602.1 cutinase family protein [Mycobacterium aquaticum]
MKSYICTAVVAAVCALSAACIAAPPASAAACPDIEVVFARGTTQPPGLGEVGQAFVDSLASKVGARSVEAYAVDYPATWDFDTGMPDGSSDASGHIQSIAATCPKTRMVLGGYSQGAGVISLTTTGMPPQIADHVAAVVLFGNLESAYAATLMHGPLPSIGPAYTGKTIDVCVPNDLICSDGQDWGAHTAYVQTGRVDEAAGFAASRL